MSGSTRWPGQSCPSMPVERAVLAMLRARPADAPVPATHEIASALQYSSSVVRRAVRNLRSLGLFPSTATTTESPA